QPEGAGARLGQGEGGHGTEERVGDLEEDAGTVAGVLLRADGAAVGQVGQRGEARVDDVAARSTAQGGDERHPAGVVLVGRVVEPLPWRRSGLRWAPVDRPHQVVLSSSPVLYQRWGAVDPVGGNITPR